MYILDPKAHVSAALLDDLTAKTEVGSTTALMIGCLHATAYVPSDYYNGTEVDSLGLDAGFDFKSPYNLLVGAVPTQLQNPKNIVWACNNFDWLLFYLRTLRPDHAYLRYFASALIHMPKQGFGIVNPDGRYFKDFKQAVPYYERRLFQKWRAMLMLHEGVRFGGKEMRTIEECQRRYERVKKEFKC